MQKWLSVGDIIRDEMVKRGISYARLEEMTGVPKSALQRYVTGTTAKIPSDRLIKIARALNYPPEILLQKSALDENDSGSVLCAIWEDNNLKAPYPVYGRYESMLNEQGFDLPPILFKNKEYSEAADNWEQPTCFFFMIKDDSMKGAGIMKEDLVLINIQYNADNGQIVACRVNNNEVTLRRYRKIGDSVMLIPENSDYEPLLIQNSDFESGEAQIIGVAVEVRKKL